MTTKRTVELFLNYKFNFEYNTGRNKLLQNSNTIRWVQSDFCFIFIQILELLLCILSLTLVFTSIGPRFQLNIFKLTPFDLCFANQQSNNQSASTL